MQQQTKTSKTMIIVLSITCLVLLTILSIVIWTLSNRPATTVTESKPNLMISEEEFDPSMIKNEDARIYFSGFRDFEIKEGESITLPCEADNQLANIYISYVIYMDDNIIYETDLISPGKAIHWTPELNSGEYNITIVSKPYMVKDPASPLTADNIDELYHVDQTLKLLIKQET